MREEIRNCLLEYAEKEYAEFSKKLVPECKPMIGVRLPLIRNFAKEIVKGKYGPWRAELESEDQYFEEVMLRGMVIGYGSSRDGNIEEALELLDQFVPVVDNWSICDSCCVSFTLFQKHTEVVYDYIQRYLYSEKEFDVRVGLILLLNHFLKFDARGKKTARRMSVTMADVMNQQEEKGTYTEQILSIVSRPLSQGYYAQMAAAWLIAESFVTYPNETYQALKSWENAKKEEKDPKQLPDDFTYNKALQKICESRTPDDEVKNMIKQMKCVKKGK